MSTYAVDVHPLAHHVSFTDADLVVVLLDGRTVSVPLVWFPRLAKATRQQLDNYEILADGEGIHWPDIDKPPGPRKSPFRSLPSEPEGRRHYVQGPFYIRTSEVVLSKATLWRQQNGRKAFHR